MAELAQRRPPAIAPTDWLKPLPPARPLGCCTAMPAPRGHWPPPSGASRSPRSACRAVVAGARATLWLGPDEYLLLDSRGPRRRRGTAHRTRRRRKASSARSPPCRTPWSMSATANSRSRSAGPHAATISERGCPLDLDLRAFPVGMCTRTVFAKADIVLWRTGQETFHFEAWRSFAAYVSGLLAEIAREFYGDIQPPA